MAADRYSVNFPDPGGDGTMACEWAWLGETPPSWTMSSKGEGEGRWYEAGRLNEEGYQALIKHFGLERVAERFPLGTMVHMSPAVLMQLRRIIERRYELEKVNPVSDRIGDHIPAEKAA